MNCAQLADRSFPRYAENETSEDHLGELRAARWSPRELSRRLPALLRCNIDHENRFLWMIGLRECWRRGSWAMETDSRGMLLEFAALCGDWPLVRAVGESMQHALDGHSTLLLVDSLRHLGEIDAAIELTVRFQLASPFDHRHARAHRSMLDDLRLRQRFPAIEGSPWGEADFRLVPLMHHHLEDFAWQYRDPAIAELCCLPEFHSEEDWHGWLERLYAEGDELPLAVLHRDFGFVGCTHLVMHGDLGFLYYWLGRDFRGQGFAFRANKLLLCAARDLFGLRACYAKVFEYNAPSRNLLTRLGFENTAIRALPPNQDEVFYRQGEYDQPHRIAEELIELLALMKSDTMVAAPLYIEVRE